MKPARSFCALAGLLLAAPAARAQQSVELIMDNFTSSALNTSLTTLNSGAVRAAATGSKPAAPARSTRLTYTPTLDARPPEAPGQPLGLPPLLVAATDAGPILRGHPGMLSGARSGAIQLKASPYAFYR